MTRPLGRLGAAATPRQHCPQMTQRRCIQGSAKRWSLGLVNFVAAVAYHICLAFPVAFTRPWDHHSAEPCMVCVRVVLWVTVRWSVARPSCVLSDLGEGDNFACHTPAADKLDHLAPFHGKIHGGGCKPKMSELRARLSEFYTICGHGGQDQDSLKH